MADQLRMVYPQQWSSISCRLCAKQEQLTGQRPTFYHCATQPVINILVIKCTKISFQTMLTH